MAHRYKHLRRNWSPDRMAAAAIRASQETARLAEAAKVKAEAAEAEAVEKEE